MPEVNDFSDLVRRVRAGDEQAAADLVRLDEAPIRRAVRTQLRDAHREVTLHRGMLPLADSVSLAAQLLGTLTTPSQAVIKAETRLLVQEKVYDSFVDKFVAAAKAVEGKHDFGPQRTRAHGKRPARGE